LVEHYQQEEFQSLRRKVLQIIQIVDIERQKHLD